MSKLVDENLLRDFINDGREHLSAIEPDFLALEAKGSQVDPETLNRVFRAIHSVKGFSVFLGFDNFTDLSHAMESVLNLFREGALEPTQESVDALLVGADKLRAMLDDIQASPEMDCSRELTALRAVLGEAQAPGQAQPTGGPAKPAGDALKVGQGETTWPAQSGPDDESVSFAIEQKALDKALKEDLRFQAVWVSPQADLKEQSRSAQDFLDNLAQCGRCLATDLEQAAQEGRAWGHCLFASIIDEAEIAAVALQVPAGQVISLAPPAEPGPAPAPPAKPAPAEAAPAPGPEGQWLKAEGGQDLDDFTLPVAPAQLTQAQEEMLHVLAVWVHPLRDLQDKGRDRQEFLTNLANCGRLLASDLESDQVGPGGYFHCLMATIIEELEIAAVALEVPLAQLKRLDKQALQPAPAPPAPPAAAPSPKPPPPAAPSPAQAPGESIRVNVGLIDNLINLAGELVLGRNQLRRLVEEFTTRAPDLASMVQNVDVVTSDLQEHIMLLRMQPVGNLFNKFPRVVRDLSRQLKKEVQLSMHGAEVELDKTILEQLSDPLTHLIRNCVDHGIELPEERERLGKERAGRIVLTAFHKEGQVNITVQDDGRGIDPDAVAKGAVAAGLISQEEAAKLTPTGKLDLITKPGLSTAKEVTDLSGRGVGMDVVSTNLAKAGGHLQIETEVGVGTTMLLRLPLTLAIIPSLVVGIGEQIFAIPQVDVLELVCVQGHEMSQRIGLVGDSPVLRLRQRLLPLVRLADVLGMKPKYQDAQTGQEHPDRRLNIADRRAGQAWLDPQAEPPEPVEPERRKAGPDRRQRAVDSNIVVLRLGANRFGLMVDGLFDTEEIVVKPLSSHIKDCKCFSGTTIMGDGRVAMILDAAGIASEARLRFGEVQAEEFRFQEAEARQQREAEARGRPVVVFNYAPDEYFALPLEEVSRLELIAADQVEQVGGRPCVQYRGSGLPLLMLDQLLPVAPRPHDERDLFFILPKSQKPQAGIVASRIVDIMRPKAQMRPHQGSQPGLAGTVVIKGHLTLVLNSEQLLDRYNQMGSDQPSQPG